MKKAIITILLWAGVARGAALPGFRVELVGTAVPFLSSIAVDSKGAIYYTTTKGGVWRLGGGRVAAVETEASGNSGLLGMALIDDRTAVVHYTTPNQVADVVSKIDLQTGEETVLHEFVCDIELPSRGSNAEHHGGNPIVAPDGSVFVGIGDYGSFAIAAMPEWNAGKVFRVYPDGRAEQFARGFRNPFDLAWDAARNRLFIPDNGDANDDEINVIENGAFCGWPLTMGNGPAVEGAVPPRYVWPTIVAPTGVLAPSARVPWMGGGYLIGSFVGRAVYFVPDINVEPFPAPIPLIERETASIIDLAEGPKGEVYFATGNAIYRLIPPVKGDCNGDGRIDTADVAALQVELADRGLHRAIDANASWGCDADGDGLISAIDASTLIRMVAGRTRAIRSWR